MTKYPGPFLQVANVTIDDAKVLQKRISGAFNTVVQGDQAAKNTLINFAGQGGDRPATPGDTQPGVVSGNFDDSNYHNPAVEAVVAAYKAFKKASNPR
jgi:hypothetical protein